MIVAVGVNGDGRREILGLDVGPSEAETFWTGFLRAVQRARYMTLETITTLSDDPAVSLPAIAS